jgi:ferredoxin
VFDPHDTTVIECDHVLVAIGQSVDLSFVDPMTGGVALNERGLIGCDPVSGKTEWSDVYVAGDLAYGPKLLIHAVASGKQVAQSIYEQLMGQPIRHEQVELHFPIGNYQREKNFEKTARLQLPTAPAHERTHSNSIEVERSFDACAAQREAGRCFDCGVNTIFDGEKCIVCGGCADVCPSLCLRLVSLDRLLTDPISEHVINNQLEGFSAEEATAIVKDETLCIRCGLCAERCPSGAITMERFIFKELPVCQVA